MLNFPFVIVTRDFAVLQLWVYPQFLGNTHQRKLLSPPYLCAFWPCLTTVSWESIGLSSLAIRVEWTIKQFR